MDKTKRAFHRMGDKMRDTGHRITNKTNSKDDGDKTRYSSKNDTRSMGASGSDTSDSARRARMDEAYANSKRAKQQ